MAALFHEVIVPFPKHFSTFVQAVQAILPLLRPVFCAELLLFDAAHLLFAGLCLFVAAIFVFV